MHTLDIFRDDAWYAYMTFFSRFDCEEALRQNGKIVVLGHKVRVRKTKNTSVYKDWSLELSLHKSQELLMHYMGFNCWTSEIVHVSMCCLKLIYVIAIIFSLFI